MAGSDEVSRNLFEWVRRKKAALHALGMHYGAKVEAEMKAEAKWTDRTGQARQGLKGGVQEREDALIVYGAHTAHHGVYLELAMKQRFAIVDPTIKRNAPDFFRDAERIIRGR